MAVRVAHDFVSAVPDGDDATVVRPSNWNADHVIEGLGTAAEADAGDFQAHSSVLDATTASFTIEDETKLDGIEAGADVTDAANVAAAGAVMDAELDSKSPPIVILSTGQSLATYHPSLAWSPEPNVYLWDWDGMVDTESAVGTAFNAMDATSMGYAYAYANMVARARPLSRVYLINIAMGGQAIAQWMTGASSPDMYATVKANVEAALTVLGVDQIDELLWRQGESDVGSSTYISDFNTVIARFRGETWFPVYTPVCIVGMSPIYAPTAGFNYALAACAAEDCETRRFVSMATIPTDFWDVDTLHMTAEGYQVSGILAFLAGWGTGDKFYVNPLTKEWVHRYDQNALTVLTIKNLTSGASAAAGLLVQSVQGQYYLQALGSGGAMAHSWYGSGPMYFQANHATGSMIFQTGGTNTRLTIDAAGGMTATGKVVSTSATGGVGYGTGAGGTVTQATSKSTNVTLNKMSGEITMNNAALNAGTIVSFTLICSGVANTDVVVANHVGAGTIGAYTINGYAGAGGVIFYVRNNTGGNLSEAIGIRYAIIKAAAA